MRINAGSSVKKRGVLSDAIDGDGQASTLFGQYPYAIASALLSTLSINLGSIPYRLLGLG